MTTVSSTAEDTSSKWSVHILRFLMDCNTFSASLGASQKSGRSVISVDLAISSFLASMSKMPPQGSYSIPQVLYLFFGHAPKVKSKKRKQK